MKQPFSLIRSILVLAFLTGSVSAWALTCVEFLYRTSFTREESPNYYGFTRQLLRDYKNDDAFFFWVWDSVGRFQTLPAMLEAYPSEREGYAAQGKREYRPQRVDLTDPVHLERPNAEFCALCPWLGAEPNTPTEYGVRLIGLRRRDVIEFPGKKFTLGKFLGRGNASHVFEVEGYPNAVLKLPFMAGNIERRIQKPGWKLDAKWPRLYLQQSVETLKVLPEDLPHVRVLEHGAEYEWALVTRISGEEDGRSFLLSLGPDLTDEQRAKKARLFRKAARYITLGHAAGQAKSLDPSKELDLFNTARQFMWHVGDWYLIDSD